MQRSACIHTIVYTHLIYPRCPGALCPYCIADSESKQRICPYYCVTRQGWKLPRRLQIHHIETSCLRPAYMPTMILRALASPHLPWCRPDRICHGADPKVGKTQNISSVAFLVGFVSVQYLCYLGKFWASASNPFIRISAVYPVPRHGRYHHKHLALSRFRRGSNRRNTGCLAFLSPGLTRSLESTRQSANEDIRCICTATE